MSPDRQLVERLQAEMSKLPQLELPTGHFFAFNRYCRFLPRPAGTLIVGKVHRKEHIYIVLFGTVRITTGAQVTDVTGPKIFISQPGTKRAVLALTDACCFTVHKTELTDLALIEEELIEDDGLSLFDSNNQLIYSTEKFRALTRRVIAGEKVGFWSDWTEQEKAFYTADDWESFSRSRGYSEEEINDYRLWRKMAKIGKAMGHSPLEEISDLSMGAAQKNILLDKRGEIEKSSVQHSWLKELK